MLEATTETIRRLNKAITTVTSTQDAGILHILMLCADTGQVTSAEDDRFYPASLDYATCRSAEFLFCTWHKGEGCKVARDMTWYGRETANQR